MLIKKTLFKDKNIVFNNINKNKYNFYYYFFINSKYGYYIDLTLMEKC